MAHYLEQRRFPYRKVNGLLVYFKDAETVYIQEANGTTHYFSRWGIKRRSDYYKLNWRPFCVALRTRKHLTILEAYKLSAKYEVLAGVSYSKTKWDAKESDKCK